MSVKQDKERVQQLKIELKAAKKNYIRNLSSNNMRLLKLTAVMLILAFAAAVIHGRVQI
jgi:hypothetical protein